MKVKWKEYSHLYMVVVVAMDIASFWGFLGTGYWFRATGVTTFRLTNSKFGALDTNSTNIGNGKEIQDQ